MTGPRDPVQPAQDPAPLELDDRSAAGTLFLERRSYRRRRLNDASKLLPIIGAVLFAIPLMWHSGDSSVPLSRVFAYVFLMWAGLIAVNALFWVGVTLWAGSWVNSDHGTSDTAGQE